jgi:NitT/TauT family transport system permease protein
VNRHRLLVTSLQVLVAVALIALWQVLVSAHVLGTFALATPLQVVDQLRSWSSSGSIWGQQIGTTLVVFIVGFAIGMVGGTIIGTLSGTVPFLHNYLGPFIAFFNSVPRLVLIPFFIVLFGFGYLPGIGVTALVIFFLVAVTVEQGVKEIQGDYVQNARMLGASWGNLMRTVYLPGVSVWILSAARASVGLAFQATVVTEFFGSSKGLGYLIVQGETQFDAPEIYAAIILTAALAYLIDLALRLVERRYVRWNVRAV